MDSSLAMGATMASRCALTMLKKGLARPITIAVVFIFFQAGVAGLSHLEMRITHSALGFQIACQKPEPEP